MVVAILNNYFEDDGVTDGVAYMGQFTVDGDWWGCLYGSVHSWWWLMGLPIWVSSQLMVTDGVACMGQFTVDGDWCGCVYGSVHSWWWLMGLPIWVSSQLMVTDGVAYMGQFTVDGDWRGCLYGSVFVCENNKKVCTNLDKVGNKIK